MMQDTTEFDDIMKCEDIEKLKVCINNLLDLKYNSNSVARLINRLYLLNFNEKYVINTKTDKKVKKCSVLGKKLLVSGEYKKLEDTDEYKIKKSFIFL